MEKILLIEDNDSIIKGIKYLLETEGFIFNFVNDLKSAKNYLLSETPNLIILDITLPDGNGFDLCKYIKEKYSIPIIILTAKDEEENIVLGFDSGTDDYIIKPFRNKELISRINHLLKKTNLGNILMIKNVKIDTLSNRVFVNDKEVILTALEYKITLLLFQNIGKLITREVILNSIWDQNNNFVNDNTLTVYIKRIRKKLNTDLITTVKGIGYRVDK